MNDYVSYLWSTTINTQSIQESSEVYINHHIHVLQFCFPLKQSSSSSHVHTRAQHTDRSPGLNAHPKTEKQFAKTRSKREESQQNSSTDKVVVAHRDKYTF